ncbi:MAG: exonuclease SbcCD subunit D [Eubacteriales bacterium]|nr:exonuclease SbcCD subunit D [Eubacteriales bacterium]
MRLLHLGDLHIGRRLNSVSLLDDQRQIVEQIMALAKDCDGVLLAGDLFDKAQPGAESIKMVSDLFVRLCGLGKPVLVISGNHDNPELLAYCRELLTAHQLYLAPAYDGSLAHYTLTDKRGPVHFWLLPFLKPASVRPFHPEVVTYDDAVRSALHDAPIDYTQRNILLAHQYVRGAESCQSEALLIGGLDSVNPKLLEGFDYVALGHLHSPQHLLGGKICYAGSPLAYSLSEEHQKKAALIVTLEEKGALSLESVPFHAPHKLRTLRGNLSQLIAEPSDDYIYAVLTDEDALLDPIGSLRLSFPNLLGMRLENSHTVEDAVFTDIETAEALSPLEHFTAFYRAQNNNQEPTARQLAILREVIAEAQEEDHHASNPA